VKSPDDGIELLVIPEAGEVEADGGGGKRVPLSSGAQEATEMLDPRCWAGCPFGQSLESDGGFFDAGGSVFVATEGAVGLFGRWR
jgi:hypothetical protein